MLITYEFFKNAARKAFTMSFDDGQAYDKKLIALFDRYGIKGTFHLNSDILGTRGCVEPSEVAEVYRDHEVSCHGCQHPWLERGPREQAVRELFDDRRRLESLVGYPVRGMSYPYGTYNDEVLEIARVCGMEYSRTIAATHDFHLPDNFLTWHPTCHHAEDCVPDLLEKFDHPEWHMYMPTMMVWGHSYEFGIPDKWDGIEAICERASRFTETWFATNIEIVDYVNALHALRFSADSTVVYNPSVISVWIGVDREPVEIRPGETKKLI